jgi:glutathione S-transferase
MPEEIGEPYDLCLLSLTKGEQLALDYLAINPMGKVPALKHGDTIITEAAAIFTYLVLPMSSRKPSSTFPSAMSAVDLT